MVLVSKRHADCAPPLIADVGHHCRRVSRSSMTPPRILSFIAKSLGVLSAVGVLFLGYVFAVSEWKIRRSYDAPLVPLSPLRPPDLGAGRHMAKIAGCWAGCHGAEGEGGF